VIARLSPRSALKSVTGREANVRTASITTLGVNLGATGLRMVIQALLARWLGPAGYGKFSLLRGWGGLIGRLPDRGYNLALVRWLPQYQELAQGRSYRALVRHSVLQTFYNAVIITVAAMAVSAFVIGDTSAETMVGLTLIITGALSVTLRQVLQATYRYVLGVSLTELVQPLVFGLLVLAFAFSVGKSVTATLVALTVSGAIVIGFELVAVRSRLPVQRDESPAATDEWRAGTLAMYVGQLGIASQEVSYLLIVGAVLGSTQAALFTVAQRIAILARMGNSAVEAIIGPQLARLGRSGVGAREEMQEIVDRGIRLSTFFTGSACVALIIGSDFVLKVFGSEYADARSMLWVLLIGMILNALTGPTGYLVSMTGSEGIFGSVMVIHAIAGGALAWLVAVVFDSALGVAIVTAATTVSWNLVFVVIAGKRLGVWSFPGGRWLGRRLAAR
jgi:O-antigen/teichoic acid export membrane protein